MSLILSLSFKVQGSWFKLKTRVRLSMLVFISFLQVREKQLNRKFLERSKRLINLSWLFNFIPASSLNFITMEKNWEFYLHCSACHQLFSVETRALRKEETRETWKWDRRKREWERKEKKWKGEKRNRQWEWERGKR